MISSTYSGLPVEECVERCRNWESWSVKEWSAADRSSKDGMTDFYRTTESRAFDLLWFAYLQAEGYGLPTSVLALQAIGARDHGPAHLDFGSGAGVTSQVFASGYETALADISTSLLDFARFRLSRRGQDARFIDLNDEQLAACGYDVITALDTLILIPDLAGVAAGLHAALRPGGWLITNFDVRPRRRRMPGTSTTTTSTSGRSCTARGSCGPGRFGDPSSSFGEYLVYRRADPGAAAQRLRVQLDRLVLTSRPRRAIRHQNRRLAAAIRPKLG